MKERILSWQKAASKRRSAMRKWNWTVILKVAIVSALLIGAGFFLRYAEGFVRAAHAGEEGSLILVSVPEWVNRDLKLRVAEVAGGNRFPIRDDTAQMIARNLAPMAWLDDVNVQVTHDAVRVKARWRKPLALIQTNSWKLYVDTDLVVLDYMPMPQLPIVEVKGLTPGPPPQPGEVFDQRDLAAAVALINLLHRADTRFAPKTPLLEQIASIDVNNYRGREDARKPHIIFNTQGDTEIWWGAEIGEWAKHLEAKDEQKLAGLYAYYREHGSLTSDIKYINVRDPVDRIPLPIDKY